MIKPIHSSVVLDVCYVRLLRCADGAPPPCLMISHSVAFQTTKPVQTRRAALIAELIAGNGVE